MRQTVLIETYAKWLISRRNEFGNRLTVAAKEQLPLGWEALTEPPEGPGQLTCCWGKKVYPEKMYPEETHHVCEHPACLKAATNFVF